jgi:3-carboxy-cis,cis-muconate cycloisomerase
LPHKRNPAMSAIILACAQRSTGLSAILQGSLLQVHERAVGAWHAEWLSVNELLRACAGAAATCAEMLEGLEVDDGRMAANLQITNGLLAAERVTIELSKHIGYSEARRAVEEASKRTASQSGPGAASPSTSLQHELARDASAGPFLAQFPPDTFDPAGSLGSAELFVDRALALYDGRPRGEPEGSPAREGAAVREEGGTEQG